MELSVILGLPVLLTGICSIFYAILVFNSRGKRKDGLYTYKDWNFFLKKFWARRAIQNWKKTRHEDIKYTWETDAPQRLHDNTCDNLTFYGSNKDNSSLYISFTRRGYRISEVILILTLEDGTTYQLPDHPRTTYTSASGDSWNAAGLSLTVQEAFKRWRIVFNGLLSSTNSSGQQELKHVRFNFIWILASSPFRIPGDCSDSLLAEAVSLKPWKNPFWLNEVTETPKRGYDQYGCFNGFYILNETTGPQTMGLHGFRKRRWQPDVMSLRRYMSLFGTASDGTVYIIDIEFTKGMTRIKHGNIRTANGDVNPIEAIDIDTELFGPNSDIPKAFTVKLSTSSHDFIVFISLNKKDSLEYHGYKPEPWKSHMIPYQMGVNGFQGSGYLQLWEPSDDEHHTEPATVGRHLTWLHLEDSDEKIPVCSSFKERLSTCPAAVGGKAASLALLSSVHSNEFCVPNGFCLTTRALQLQMQHNPQLVEAVKNIEKAGENYNESHMKECCQRATSLFESTPICDIVKVFIMDYYEKLCDTEKEHHSGNLFVAVRSSGIGEDSEELSAAGQNATILGCKSIDEVLVGVQKCWASLFTFQSVEYRRQYGQVVDCGMGVVVQAMVESESAGVMFTKHPNNGNPREILITSSYGLGESVVSGHVEPDTIIVNVDGEKLTIKSYEVGKKGQKIVLDHTGSQQTQILEMKDDEGQERSISEEHCLMLAKLGLEQEAMWGSPRDIEWAIVKGKIYLLQARPITCLNSWTEYELLHEQDTAIMSDEDLMTFANTGEVMPGALAPLTQTTLIEILDSSIAHQVVVEGKKPEIRPFSSMLSTHHQIGINIFNSFLRFPEKKVTVRSKTFDLAICGHEITTERMLSIAFHRHGYERFFKIKSMANIGYLLWISKKKTERSLEICNNFKIDLTECSTALEMYEKINRCSKILEEAAKCHTMTTTASAASQIVFLSILLGSETDFTLENYQDIGTILSSCSDVVSADIPESLKKISRAINESGKAQAFSEQKPEEAKDWLEKNIPNVYSMLMEFLEKHGHRCIKEFDLMEDPWGLNPTPLLKTLQASSSISFKADSLPMTTDELIAKLVTPINNTTKKILKFIIPICQISVARRESTKAAFILATHRLRLAYHQLGKQMIKEWRIPEMKLLYMLTNSDLGRLLRTRDPGILAKAKLKKRYFPKWNKIQFNELNWGFPQPIVEDNKLLSLNGSNSSVVIHGTPVFSGDIVARACVIRDISKIDELQNGDILVTHSTDIGWSPYFPMLGGVVTELGGLISHGAVVAREYGLPCIVGAQGATNAFKTGDTVLLAAASGLLKKVEKS